MNPTVIPYHRRPAVLVAVLTALGAAVRLWNFPSLGLEHFDEGIYAFAGLWVVRPGGLLTFDPSTIPYAPPGFPILVGLSYLLTFPWPGVSDLSAILPAELCGIAAIPVIYWVGARTFNVGTGIAAAALLAAAGPHVAFSRMALTDTPFLLAWLVAIGLGGRFLERPGAGRAAAFGLAVGIAQYVKYNGWLVGVIVAATVVLDIIVASTETRRRAVRALAFGLLAAVVAALVYAPWFLFVERHGGYGAVLKHQRGYLMPASSWLPNLRLQLAQWVALSGLVSGELTWGAIGWGLGWIGRQLVGPSREPSRWSRVWTRITLLGGVALMGLLPTLPWWIGLGFVSWLLRDSRPAVRLVGAGWVVLTILTPFYHPYARLMLPLQAFCWLITAAVIGEILPAAQLDETRSWPLPTRSARGVTMTLAVVAGLVCHFLIEPRPVPYPALLAPSDSLKSVAARISTDVKARGATAPIAVYARPPLAFYLNTLHTLQTSTLPAAPYFRKSWDTTGRPPSSWILIDEVLTFGGPAFRSSSPIHVESYKDLISLPTLLDADPRAAYGTTRLGSRQDDPTDWRFSQISRFARPSVPIMLTPQY